MTPPPAVLLDLARVFLMAAGGTAAGLAAGSGLGLLALHLIKAEARGGAILLLGLAALVGAGIGLLVGLILAHRWLAASRR